MMIMMISVIRWGGYICPCGLLCMLRECVDSSVLSVPVLSVTFPALPYGHPHRVLLVSASFINATWLLLPPESL